MFYTICWPFPQGYSFYKSSSDDPSSISIIESSLDNPSSISIIESSLDDPSSISLIIVIDVEWGSDAITKVSLQGLERRNQAEFSRITIKSRSCLFLISSLIPISSKKIWAWPTLTRGFPIRKDLKNKRIGNLRPFMICLFLFMMGNTSKVGNSF